MEYIFEDVLEIKNGKNQKAVENSEGLYPIYGSGGVMGYADDYICDADTVIIGRKGNINNPIYVNERFWNVDTAFGLSAKRELLLPRYLFYFCKKFDFEKLNKTVTIPSLTKSDLLKIKIDLPVISEQQDVVDRLSKIEAVIELRKQKLSALDDLIKARFVEMFGIPLLNDKGWNVISATECCSIITDGSHFSPQGQKDGYPMLSVKDMRNDGFHYEKCKKISEKDFQILKKQGCIPKVGDVLISKDGSYFYYGFVLREYKEQAILSSIAMLRPVLNRVNPYYLCNYMLSEGVVSFVGDNYVTGAALKRVILKGIKQIPVMLPPIELQNQFADFVQQVDKSKFEELKVFNLKQKIR